MKPQKRSVPMLVLAVSLAGSALQSVPAGEDGMFRKEEVVIQAGGFTVVGDLILPAAGARHPLVIWVHGSGPITRTLMTPLLRPQIDIFLKAGFAFFIDDIPGSGASRGVIKKVYVDRARILAAEVEALRKRPDIIPGRVGIAGLSQAGIVMPLAARDSGHVAFMIAEGCVAQNAVEQEAFLLEQFMLCENAPAEEARRAGRLHLERHYTEDYETYRAAAEFLNSLAAVKLLELNEPVVPSNGFTPPQRTGWSYFDPMPIISSFSFPVLALFGANDKNINPVQGAEAYDTALKAAKNPFFRVQLIPGANHLLYASPTGCARELLEQVQAGKPAYAPEVLSTIAAWLEDLKRILPDNPLPAGR